jgi:hypothetical protein
VDQLLELPAAEMQQNGHVFHANFAGEEGIGTGPLREFFCDVGQAMAAAALESCGPDVFRPAAGGWTGPGAKRRLQVM